MVVIIMSDGRSKLNKETVTSMRGIGVMDLERAESSNHLHGNTTPNAYLFEDRNDDFVLAMDRWRKGSSDSIRMLELDILK
jgi:hypothetical protein